jgi:hypothetical protein
VAWSQRPHAIVDFALCIEFVGGEFARYAEELYAEELSAISSRRNADDLVNMGCARHNSQRFLLDWRPIASRRPFKACEMGSDTLCVLIEFSAGRLGLAALRARLTDDLLPKSRT